MTTQDVASLITPFILFCSALGVYLGIRNAKIIARGRATLDLIEKVESSPHYRQLHDTFRHYRKKQAFSMLHDPKEERDKSDRQAVVDYLNHYEYVALGIKKNLLDEEFYKNWMASAFVKDWNTASEFIQRIRWKYNEDTGAWEYKSIVFEHYQDIATKWSKDAVKLAENSQPNHPEKPSGVGDEELPEINNS